MKNIPHRDRMKSDVRNTLASFAQAYNFETPNGHLIPNDLEILVRQVKEHGYLIGKMALMNQDTISSKIVYFGPPRLIKIDENGYMDIIAD